ncbi:MAG: lysoplasmalogenase [Ilumatobacteraceae bacterium]
MRAALLCLIVLTAAANWWSRLPGERRLTGPVELVSKPLTTVLVIVLALTADAPHVQVVTAAVALSLCLLGDVALMGPPSLFVVGLGAFAFAHVAFVVLFVRYGLDHRTLAGIAVIVGALVAATVGKIVLLHARTREPQLTGPVALYLVVILTMAAFGWATGRGFVLTGTALFVLSDSLIGWGAFVREGRWQPLAVMVTYHAAIVSLALSLT